MAEDSNLVEHAKHELLLLGNEEGYNDTIIEIVRLFASMGHGGGSAFYTIPLIDRLLSFQNLTELTNDPEEWMQVEMEPGYGCWQSRRRSDAFTYDPTFRLYYTLDEHPGMNAEEFDKRAKLPEDQGTCTPLTPLSKTEEKKS